MNFKSGFLLLLITVSNFCFAQNAFHSIYTWESTPAIHTLTAGMTGYPAVFVLHNRILELRVDGGTAKSFFTEHKIIHINTNAGIEQFNKVYIPMHGNKQLISLEVRSIDPSGKITNLKKDNLKELQNVDGFGNYKIFAVEGLTVGGEIEYVYTTKADPQTYGREVFQQEIPIVEANLEILSPERFSFSAKSYNGLAKPKASLFDGGRRSLSVNAKNIPALLEEEYAAHKANLMRVDYKLDNNGQSVDMVSWSSIAERFLMNSYESSATAKANKFLKPLKLDALSELEKVRAVEKYIKSNFTLKESGQDAYEDTKRVIENHVGSERGILKLYMSCWEALDLSPELVFCSNRYRGNLDQGFASPHDINEIIFYFPSLNQYLTPNVAYMRLGAAPDNLASSTGLFIDYAFANNKIRYNTCRFKTIEPLDYTHNDVGVKALISFKEKLDLPEITQTNFWQGYRAALYRGIYYYRQGADKEEFIKDVTLSGIEGVDLIKRQIEGEDINLSFDPENYFTVNTRYTASSLIEKAGDDYLLAIGKIIGKQSELYQERERQMDIEFRSISDYNHELIIEIPAGYTCSGLDALKIKNELSDGKEIVMRFYSDYTLEGNKLTIKVNETYKVLKVPKEKYDPFRTVINSAADFNKVVLVLHQDNP